MYECIYVHLKINEEIHNVVSIIIIKALLSILQCENFQNSVFSSF